MNRILEKRARPKKSELTDALDRDKEQLEQRRKFDSQEEQVGTTEPVPKVMNYGRQNS